MSGRHASSSEMPGFYVPGRPGNDLDEPLLDALLSGKPISPEASPQVSAVADMLAILSGRPEPGELAGERAARLAYASRRSPVVISHAARRPTRRRSWLTVRPARLIAVGLMAALGLGGTAAAYAGALPGPIQSFAHRTIGAPAAPHAAPTGPSRPQPGSSQGPPRPRSTATQAAHQAHGRRPQSHHAHPVAPHGQGHTHPATGHGGSNQGHHTHTRAHHTSTHSTP
ncbi:MAG TPA: hypothetical protein VGS19_35800 [Streptosporangiaceae bacterium]|nr:hypothetical protein [Streptosporangiaceae bacterium]